MPTPVLHTTSEYISEYMKRRPAAVLQSLTRLCCATQPFDTAIRHCVECGGNRFLLQVSSGPYLDHPTPSFNHRSAHRCLARRVIERSVGDAAVLRGPIGAFQHVTNSFQSGASAEEEYARSVKNIEPLRGDAACGGLGCASTICPTPRKFDCAPRLC